jgi:hypothetical protein
MTVHEAILFLCPNRQTMGIWVSRPMEVGGRSPRFVQYTAQAGRLAYQLG